MVIYSFYSDTFTDFYFLFIKKCITELAGSLAPSLDVMPEAGYSSLILDNLEFSNGNVTGFFVSMGDANCPVKIQVWRRRNSLQYELHWETPVIVRNSPGVFFVSASRMI